MQFTNPHYTNDAIICFHHVAFVFAVLAFLSGVISVSFDILPEVQIERGANVTCENTVLYLLSLKLTGYKLSLCHGCH